MARRLREDQPGSWHHVMNRGAARQRTFFIGRDGATFERLLGEGHARFGVEVHAYCLMPNHFHLLVHCPNGDLGRFMQHVTGTYTRLVNDRLRRDGALFRGRYHALTVRDERYLLAAARYIHRNPLDIDRTAPLRAYPWSSHGIYLGDRPQPPWLRSDHVLDMFEGGAAAFEETVSSDDAPPLASVPLDHLLDFLDLVIDENDESPTNGSRRAHRTVALALLEHLDSDRRARIIAELNFSDRTALDRARTRAAERHDRSPEISWLVERICRRAA